MDFVNSLGVFRRTRDTYIGLKRHEKVALSEWQRTVDKQQKAFHNHNRVGTVPRCLIILSFL